MAIKNERNSKKYFIKFFDFFKLFFVRKILKFCKYNISKLVLRNDFNASIGEHTIGSPLSLKEVFKTTGTPDNL